MKDLGSRASKGRLSREALREGAERVEKLKSTTKLTTAEFTDYMDAIDRWAVSLGFVWQEAA